MKVYEKGNWVIVEDVPILDEHVLTDDDGNPVMNVDTPLLKRIAKVNNQRAKETGDLAPIVIGHTKDDAPEKEQPEIVGYASNYRVKRLLNTARNAIHATFKLFRDKLDLVRQFPRRSVEFWLSDLKIDPIALLGATTPERDLGMLRLSKGGKRTYRRILSTPIRLEKDVPDDNINARDNGAKGDQKAIVDAVMAALQQTAPWKYLEQLMAEDESDDGLPPDDEVQLDDVGLDDDLPPEDPLGEDDFLMDDDFDGGDDDDFDDDLDDEDRPARYSAGYPGGGNTFTPQFGFDNRRRKPMPKRNSKSRTPSDNLKLRRAQEQQSIQLARTQRALFATAQQLEDLKLKYRRSEREKDLIHLEAAEGILLDREEELDLVETMNEDQYRKHLARIRKNYQRAPTGGDTWFGGPGSRMPDQSRTGLTTDKDTMNRIVAHAMNRGIGYPEAKAELMGDDPTF